MGKGWRARKERPTARWGVSRADAERAGYRSSYEYALAQTLQEEGVEFEYEPCTYKVRVPCSPSKYEAVGGGAVVKVLDYTPDFLFLNRTIIVEAKGRMDGAYRVKAKAFKDQHPDVVYAFVFEEDNKISPKSKTRYTDWAKKANIPCKVGLITREWLEEITQ
jgi:hypothetical protein